MRALKSQMSEARSVKGSSQPEFDDKLNRLKALREQKASVQARISDIRGHVKGLQVKTEADLDKAIQQEEERIRFGGVTLREEKQVLAELSKLRAQRDKIRQYEAQKGSLAGLEAELAKVKSSIDELDAEFNMVKTERDAVVSEIGRVSWQGPLDCCDQAQGSVRDAHCTMQPPCVRYTRPCPSDA